MLALGGLGGCSSGLEYNVKPEEFAKQAEANEGSTAWAYEASKYPNDDIKKKYYYPRNSWKCNLFINDILYDSGITPPKQSNGWPPYAKDWADASFYIPNWEHKGEGSGVTWERGDVIANKIGSNSGHCGIAISSSKVMAAGEKKVHDGSDGDHELTGCSVRRYTGS
ncbi:MAG: hypothetical protein K2X94_02625 [Amoebophilaceae bacterium]|nr:hypothetical protein [Amoebophilaceae bacterium]